MYKIYFSEMDITIGEEKVKKVRLEILPEKLTYTMGREVTIHNMLGIGEVVRPGKPKLRTWQINSVLEPNGERSVDFYQSIFKQLRESQVPFTFTIIRLNEDGSSAFGGNTDEQVSVILEDCSFEEREGEIGTLYYKIKLIEYIKFEALPVDNTGFIKIVARRGL